MPLGLSTARYLAPASFLYDFAAQQYGILSSPSMKSVHDANLSFFSPQPYFIAGFFFPQQLFQMAWLYKLWRARLEKEEGVEEMLRFVPFYALGNVCIGTWMFAWTTGRLALADVFVVVNTATQLWYTFTQLPPMNTRSTPSVLTHVVVKTFAGIGVLDLLHNTSVAFAKDAAPSGLIKVLTSVGFIGMSAVSDWIFGGCLVYDLVALSVGQASYSRDGSWSGLLAGLAGVCAVVVGAKNYVRPPYVSHSEYEAAAQEEEDVGR